MFIYIAYIWNRFGTFGDFTALRLSGKLCVKLLPLQQTLENISSKRQLVVFIQHSFPTHS